MQAPATISQPPKAAYARKCVSCNIADVTKLAKHNIEGELIVLCQVCTSTRRTKGRCKRCSEEFKFMFKDPLDQSVRCINCIVGKKLLNPVPIVVAPPKPPPPPASIMTIASDTLETEPPQQVQDEKLDDVRQYLEDELAKIIGRDDLKQEILEFQSLLETNKIKEMNGLPVAPIPLHLVLTGNPGTGKTTIARILGQLYRKMAPRLVQSNKFKELRGQDLIAGYVGQTSKVVDQLAEEFKHGVIFLDEAYAIMPGAGASGGGGGGGGFATDAVNAIMKHMGDPDGSNPTCIWIFAGYKKEMDSFLKMNDGLLRRLPQRFDLRDYTAQELRDIFRAKLTKLQEDLHPPDLWDRLPGLIEDIMPKSLIQKTNAGLSDQLYDKTNRIRATRYTVAEKKNNPSILQIFLEEDIKQALNFLAKNEM